MPQMTHITPDIIRMTVPYMDVYTTVCIIRTPDGAVLFDTASYESDVTDYILPALNDLGITADTLKYIVISHNHGDHSGGLEQLIPHFPATKIVSLHSAISEKHPNRVLSPKDGETLLNVLSVITIPGHAADALGLLDTRTGTLLSGDSLQVYGIYGLGKWGANITLPIEHLTALEKLHTLDINSILASHDYHPYGHTAQGKEAVTSYINACKEALMNIKSFICTHPELDNDALELLYVAETKLPTVSSRVFSAVRTAMAADMI